MIGKIVCNRYRIIDHLGTGGMATVWLAEDQILNRKVAVKTFKIDAYDEDAIKRFNREANAVTTLSHNNIVSIYGVENEDNFYYLILEYVEGTTLKEYMTNNKNISLDIVIHIMKQISDGLSHAHRNGIIHRDIKPQNILMTKDLTCKITDFGISRAYGDTTLTQTNQMLGTVYYLSPEQARGNVATAQSDIYSLGILMYELITGKIPFKGESAVAIALKHLQEELPNIDKYRAGVPQSVKNIILKATMKNPNERYLSAREFNEDLKTCLNYNRLDETEYKGFSALKNNQDYNETAVQPIPKYNTNIQEYYDDEYDYEEDEIEYKNNKKYNSNNKKEETKKSSILKFFTTIVVTMLVLTGGFFAYSYFGSSSKISMPDVKNMNIEEAKELIIKAELKVGEITKVASDTVSEDTIISSDPSAGKKVSKGSEVNLKVSSGKETVEMPNYLGMTETQVKNSIEKIGFKNIIFEKGESDEYAEGKVMEQSVVAGKEIVPKDTSVTITISTGSKEITVPNLVGKTEAEAYNILSQLNLELGTVTEEYSTKYSSGEIISQSPSSNSKLKKGSKVSIVISKGTDSKIVVPDFVAENYTVREVIAWSNTNGVDVKITNDTYTQNSLVTKQSIKGTITKGTVILISVS